MVYKKIILLGYFLFSTGLIAGPGTSGFEFLRTDFSARSAAMGGAFVAMRGDLNSFFHNQQAWLIFRKDNLILIM